jgi:hypothetical protein
VFPDVITAVATSADASRQRVDDDDAMASGGRPTERDEKVTLACADAPHP